MSSISSADDDQESVGDDAEQMSSYYKTPGGMGPASSGWQDPQMDPGKKCHGHMTCHMTVDDSTDIHRHFAVVWILCL